jgi:hypothetical protein
MVPNQRTVDRKLEEEVGGKDGDPLRQPDEE